MSFNSTETVSGFQLRMYRRVIDDHATTIEHNAYCCQVVRSYEEILRSQPSMQPPAPVASRYSVQSTQNERTATEPQVRYVRGLMSNRQISHQEMQTWGLMIERGLTFGQADMIIKALKDRPLADRSGVRMATPGQIHYVKDLLENRQWDEPVTPEDMTFEQISSLIDALKAAKRKPSGAAVASEAQEGVYFFDGLYVKVQRAVHGSGRLYTKVFDPQSESWDRQSGYLRKLKPEHKLTAEQAAQFGQLYGKCVFCHLTLTKERAIERGYGDDCAENNGLPL